MNFKVKAERSDSFSELTLVGAGSVFRGEMSLDHDVRIDGEFYGTLRIGGRLVVGAEGKICVDHAECGNADISGLAEGTLTVSGLLQIRSVGRVNSDIAVGKLSIEPGGQYNGKCTTVTPGVTSVSGLLENVDKSPLKEAVQKNPVVENPSESGMKVRGK